MRDRHLSGLKIELADVRMKGDDALGVEVGPRDGTDQDHQGATTGALIDLIDVIIRTVEITLLTDVIRTEENPTGVLRTMTGIGTIGDQTTTKAGIKIALPPKI